MNEELRCPHCKGDKLQKRGNEEYKCLYCGSVFRHTSSIDETTYETPYDSPTSNVPASNTPNVNVNVNVGQPQPTYQSQNNFANGAATGAGAVAGGCLAGTAIYLAGPIIFLIMLMAMCS